VTPGTTVQLAAVQPGTIVSRGGAATPTGTATQTSTASQTSTARPGTGGHEGAPHVATPLGLGAARLPSDIPRPSEERHDIQAPDPAQRGCERVCRMVAASQASVTV
jgi:hypothetical protein